MTSITDGLYLAQRALYAQQFGLEVTQQNVSNVNTPGYSKERADFAPGDLTSEGIGSGIGAISVDSFRNKFIDVRVNQELQGQGEHDAVLAALQQVEAVLNGNGGQDLQGALSDFFNSFSALSAKPDDLALRQDVISKGTALAEEFNRAYNTIQGVQSAQDGEIADTANEINTLTDGIAQLNARVGRLQGSGTQDEALAVDQRQKLLDQLSSLIDISYFESESGQYTVTTKQGALLVAGNQSQQLQTSSTGSLLRVEVGGADITSRIQSGKLGGLLKTRDTLISGYLQTLDNMAATLISRVNAQHALGDDYGGQPGGSFFVPFTQPAPGSNAGAARTMAMAISDPKAIAAAASGAGPGDNTNALVLAGIKDETIFAAGATANQAYANLIDTVGNDERKADDLSQTQTQILTQLQNQRDSFSGVNLDEEATDIIRYQKAYQASARFVQVLNTLSDEIINILGY